MTVNAPAPASAAEAHKVFMKIALMLTFVVIATVIAGINGTVGNATALFMVTLLIVQGVTHGQMLSSFLDKALGA